MASGAIRSGTMGNAAVLSGSVGSGQIASGHMASGLLANLGGSLTSGQVGSGYLASGSVQGFFGTTPNIASGTVGSFDLSSGAVTAGTVGSGAIVSGNIASGQVGLFTLASGVLWATSGSAANLSSGSVQSGHIASGSVQGFFGSTRNIASGTVGSFDLGSGAVLAGTVGSGAIQSGQVASGQLSTFHFASGAIITAASEGIIFTNAGGAADWKITAAEIISGVRAVSITQSGLAQIAMASVSGRMPAIGVVPGLVASGALTKIRYFGNFPLLSGLSDFSGYLGQPLYVGRSGQLVSPSGSWNSGGFLSGDIIQIVGAAIISGQALITIQTPNQSGGIPFLGSGAVTSGVIGNTSVVSGSYASGSISHFALASPAVFSGQIGSGSVTGQNAAGFFVIASGSIGTNDIGSGSVVSGNIASGQIGFGHLANASVQSGTIASGQINSFDYASGSLIDFSQYSLILSSGLQHPTAIVTGEIISGVRAVCLSQSGFLQQAMASVSGRMPAIGVVVNNVLSGIQTNVFTTGIFQFTSGMIDFSGTIGQLLYVGRSGQVVQASGWFNSGGLLSGDVSQPIGILAGSGLGMVSVTAMLPFVLGLITSGNIASGQIGFVHLANASVQSGTLASGQINTFHVQSGGLGSGAIGSGQIGQFHHASGSVSSGHIGNAAVVSGSLASGQIGQAHLASGAVQSGQIASGVPITYARNVLEDTYLTGEIVSGLCPVAITSGGVVVVAQGGSGLRMPAFGVANGNALSGVAIQVILHGKFLMTSGLYKIWSGLTNPTLYVSTSGFLMTNVQPTSGLSQIMGLGISGGMYVMPSLIMASGAGAPQSGLL